MSGVAEGNAIFTIPCQRASPRARSTSSNRGSIAANPWIAASRAGQIEPKAITPSAICGVKPKIAIATGMTAEAGSGAQEFEGGRDIFARRLRSSDLRAERDADD